MRALEACTGAADLYYDITPLIYFYAYGTTAMSDTELSDLAAQVTADLGEITDQAVEAGQLDDKYDELAHLVTELGFTDAQDEDDLQAVQHWCTAEGIG